MVLDDKKVEIVKQYLLGSILPSREVQELVRYLTPEVVMEVPTPEV